MRCCRRREAANLAAGAVVVFVVVSFMELLLLLACLLARSCSPWSTVDGVFFLGALRIQGGRAGVHEILYRLGLRHKHGFNICRMSTAPMSQSPTLRPCGGATSREGHSHSTHNKTYPPRVPVALLDISSFHTPHSFERSSLVHTHQASKCRLLPNDLLRLLLPNSLR